MLSFGPIYNLVSSATCLNSFMGLALVLFQKYSLLSTQWTKIDNSIEKWLGKNTEKSFNPIGCTKYDKIDNCKAAWRLHKIWQNWQLQFIILLDFVMKFIFSLGLVASGNFIRTLSLMKVFKFFDLMPWNHYSWFHWHWSGNGQNMNFGFSNFF